MSADFSPVEKPDHLSPETPTRLAGDWTDDDGQALEEYFEPADHGPVDQAYVSTNVESLKVTTRLISREIPFPFSKSNGDGGLVFGGDIQPVRVLPADPDRSEFMVTAIMGGIPSPGDAYGGNFTVYFALGDSKSFCHTSTRGNYTFAASMTGTDSPISMCHTGEVWILPKFGYSDDDPMEHTITFLVTAVTV